MPKNRINFPSSVIRKVRERAAFICSNPDCRFLTIAPSSESEEKVLYTGEVAHITAASEGGARFDSEKSDNYRRSIENAIYLCSNCAGMIDKNGGEGFSVEKLISWKSIHEKWVGENLNKAIISPPQNININIGELSDPKKEHDRKIFIESETIINEELLREILYNLVVDESILRGQRRELNRYMIFLKKTSNEFLNEELESKKVKMIKMIDCLLAFLGTQFFYYPQEQHINEYSQLCMSPELNVDRDGRGTREEDIKHAEFQDKLKSITDQLESDFDQYRRIVARILHL